MSVIDPVNSRATSGASEESSGVTSSVIIGDPEAARRVTRPWLMLSSIAFNYWMAIAVDRRHGTAAARAMLAFAVTANLVVLGIFKYANFFADNVNTLLLALQVQPLVLPRVLLPIGISFFTFHAISYVVDVYRRDATAQKSPVHGRYISDRGAECRSSYVSFRRFPACTSSRPAPCRQG